MEHGAKTGKVHCHKKLRSRLAEYMFVFLTGACIYYVIELLWRGYSHITMFFAGGICFSLIYFFEKRLSELRLIYRCIIYSLLITAVEFVFGVIFNLILHMNVWDYSHRAFNILGQVCPLFVVLWAFLSVPAILLCSMMRRFFGKKNEQIA